MDEQVKRSVEAIDNFIDSVHEALEIPDVQFEEFKDQLIEKMREAFTDETIIENGIEEFYNTYPTYELGESAAKHVVEVLDQVFNGLKAGYSDPNKHEFIDEMSNTILELYTAILAGFYQRLRTIYIEPMNQFATTPTYAHDTDAGCDIYSAESVTLAPHSYGNMIHTGLKMAIPVGWQMSIRPRSGMSAKTTLRISNAPGTIDSGYRGEVCVLMDNIGDAPQTIEVGDRIAQFIFEKVNQANFRIVPSVAEIGEDRNGGFGSSGK